MFKFREYKRVQSLEEAWSLNQKKLNKIIGGMLWLKMTGGNVGTVIDLSGLGLNNIEETTEEFRIGCMTTLRQLELHQGLDSYSQGSIRKALHSIVGVQFRNLATVGGSVFGRFGFSDVITVLMAMDTYVELYKGGIKPLAEFVASPYDRDILVNIIIKKTPGSFAYQFTRITKTDFPVLNCSAALTAKGICVNIGARPGKCMAVKAPEALVKAPLNIETIAEWVMRATETIPTDNCIRGTAAYRKHLIGVLTRRALQELGGAACR